MPSTTVRSTVVITVASTTEKRVTDIITETGIEVTNMAAEEDNKVDLQWRKTELIFIMCNNSIS